MSEQTAGAGITDFAPAQPWHTAHLYWDWRQHPPVLFDYPPLPEFKAGTYSVEELKICEKELHARWLFAVEHGVEIRRGVWPRPVPEYARADYYARVGMPDWEIAGRVLNARKPQPPSKLHPILRGEAAKPDFKERFRQLLIAEGRYEEAGVAPPADNTVQTQQAEPEREIPQPAQPQPAAARQPVAVQPAQAATAPAAQKVNGTMPALAMTYMVYWEDHGVLKVGRAYKNSRWRSLIARGAKLIFLDRDTIPIQEKNAQALLAARFPRAFATENDLLAQELLPQGRGFSECFRVSSVAEYNEAFHLYMQGVDEYEQQAAEVVAQQRLKRHAVSDATGSGEVYRGGIAAARGRRGALSAEPQADSGSTLPARYGDDRAGVAAASGSIDRGGLAASLRDQRGLDSADSELSGGAACQTQPATSTSRLETTNTNTSSSGSDTAGAAAGAGAKPATAGARKHRGKAERTATARGRARAKQERRNATACAAASAGRKRCARSATGSGSSVTSPAFTGAAFAKQTTGAESRDFAVAVLQRASTLRYRSQLYALRHGTACLPDEPQTRGYSRTATAVSAGSRACARSAAFYHAATNNNTNSTSSGSSGAVSQPATTGYASTGGMDKILDPESFPDIPPGYSFHEIFMRLSWLWSVWVRARVRESACVCESASGRERVRESVCAPAGFSDVESFGSEVLA